MSLVSMTNVAVARRSDTKQKVPTGPADVNAAAHGDTTPSNDAITTAMGAVISYFPSEISVLYTAIVAAITITSTNAAKGPTTQSGQWVAYAVTCVLTPLAVLLLYAARVRATPPAQQKTSEAKAYLDKDPADRSEHPPTLGTPLLKWKQWPLTEMIVSTIAFTLWAAALPASPFREIKQYTGTVAGVVVLVGTTVLGWAASAFPQQITVDAAE
jgi:RsiW-degrading membrane proteinase PrsW (M82 family)